MRRLHRWDVSLAEATAIQRRLAPEIVAEGGPGEVRVVAGVDVGFPGGTGRAAVVLLSYPDLAELARGTAEFDPPFPYVPGYLSFRETPLVAAAFERLDRSPDLVIVDGQGVAHPRRFGIAAHLGLLLDLPTIGCAKSRLVGTGPEPGPDRGDWAPLTHGGELVGAQLRTRPGVKPVYVSVGHRISLDCALEWVLRCTTRYRLPEPIRAAHRAASG